MSPSPRILIKALLQLGPRRLALYARYQIGLRSGYYRRRTPIQCNFGEAPKTTPAWPLIPVPAKEDLRRMAAAGSLDQACLLSGPDLPPLLSPSIPAAHWIEYELRRRPWGEQGDPKFIWEPARFDWAYTLARSYVLTGDERFPDIFWKSFEAFLEANPPNAGPNWSSGQEIALRLIALTFAGGAFAPAKSSTPERMAHLAAAITAHAQRIPITMVYARSQDNNHLVSEAAGLITAGLLFPGLAEAERWLSLGRRWLEAALRSQIAADGEYCQHSANYHRLMLQLALWCRAILRRQALDLSTEVLAKLASATRWLARLLDRQSGRVPNLGANDGAHVQPLAASFEDYRPVVQAAARVFLGGPCLPPGSWDELSLWLGERITEVTNSPFQRVDIQASADECSGCNLVRLEGRNSWAMLRAARFTNRPSHADQLAVDLWWCGLNLAQDAGTYRYTAPPPWDNALASVRVHNTISVDDQQPMLRTGRFLWLDWDQAVIEEIGGTEAGERWVSARRLGYAKLGVLHQRTLRLFPPDNWEVEDQLLPSSRRPPREHAYRLHWLLPDWPWSLDPADLALELASPWGSIRLSVEIERGIRARTTLARCGERLAGEGAVQPVDGWISPNYGLKRPALSWSIEVDSPPPVILRTRWELPD